MPSDASSSTVTSKHIGGDLERAELEQMSREELTQIARTLQKERAALEQQVEVISGSGKHGSNGGMHTAAPPAGAPAGESPRKSGVSFAPAHRNSVLVVEFQRPSMVTQTPDQLR
jgi:hypothetical protein